MTGLSLWTARNDLVQFAARTLLARHGMGPASVEVTQVGLYGLRLRNLRLYGGAVQAAGLDLTYSPLHLAAGIVDRAEITSPLVMLDATGDAITVGGAPLAFATPAPARAASATLSVAALRLTDAHISLATPSGTLEAGFSTDLALTGGGAAGTGLTLDLSAPGIGPLHITAPELAIAPQESGGVRLRFAKLGIVPETLPWALTGLAGEITWQDGKLAAKLSSAQLTSTQSPALIVPLTLSADAAMTGPDITFALHATDATGKIDVHVTGQHDRGSGAGHAAIDSRKLSFQPTGLQPKDLFPASAGSMDRLTGAVSVSGTIAWHGTAFAPALVLHLADLAYTLERAELTRIRGDITLSGLAPITTRPAQLLQAVITAAGLPPVDTSLTFQLLPSSVLHVQAIDMGITGGRIVASPFDFDPARPDLRTVLAVHQVDLAEIFKLIGLPGLSGTGRLDGQIPLAIAGARATIADGHLTASGPGTLRLSSDSLPQQITDAGAPMTLALQALADFHYDSLTIDLAAGPAGADTAILSLKGNNPALLEGRAFNLNIKLETNFQRLIDIAMRSMAAAEQVLRQTAGSVRK